MPRISSLSWARFERISKLRVMRFVCASIRWIWHSDEQVHFPLFSTIVKWQKLNRVFRSRKFVSSSFRIEVFGPRG